MGTRSAKASIRVEIETLIRNLLATGGPITEQRRALLEEIDFTTGTTANKCDRILVSEGRALAVGSETVDLYDLASLNIGAGAGLDGLGQAWVAAEIVGIIVRNNDADGTLYVGGEGTTAAFNSMFGGSDDGKVTVPPGGMFMLVAPGDPAFAVADSSNHLLKIEAVTADVASYDLYILARSA